MNYNCFWNAFINVKNAYMHNFEVDDKWRGKIKLISGREWEDEAVLFSSVDPTRWTVNVL